MNKMFGIILISSLLSVLVSARSATPNESWLMDFETLVELDRAYSFQRELANGEINASVFIEEEFGDRPFQRYIFTEAHKIINKIVDAPISDVSKHRELDARLMDIYTCRDYIMYKNGSTPADVNVEKAYFKAVEFSDRERMLKYLQHKKIVGGAYVGDLSKDALAKKKHKCLDLYYSVIGELAKESKK